MALFRWFILRRLRAEPVRTTLTVAGIALGVGVVLAIRLANQSALGGFRAALDTVAGKTSLEITGAGLGVSEDRLSALGWLRAWGDVSPVIEGDAMALVSQGRAEAMRVLGVDILQDQPLRDYRLLQTPRGEATAESFLRLLIDPTSMVVSEGFARRHGLVVGSALSLSIGDVVHPFVIRALLRNEGPARVMDGNFVLMDIAAAQWAFDRLGRVDRVDLRLADPGTAGRSRARHRVAPARGTGRAAAGAPGCAGRADAGIVPVQPGGALVGGGARRTLSRSQHGLDVGHRAARGDRHAARARRRTPDGARAVSRRGAGARSRRVAPWALPRAGRLRTRPWASRRPP